jgi:hypothetical protein
MPPSLSDTSSVGHASSVPFVCAALQPGALRPDDCVPQEMKRLVSEHFSKTADRLDDLASKQGALQRQADNTDAAVEPLESSLGSLRRQVEALAARPIVDTSLPARVSELTSAVADGLRQSCESAKLLTARIEGCESSAEHAETRHSMITQQLSALNSELPLLAQRIESLIPEIAELRDEQVSASSALAEQIGDGRIKVESPGYASAPPRRSHAPTDSRERACVPLEMVVRAMQTDAELLKQAHSVASAVDRLNVVETTVETSRTKLATCISQIHVSFSALGR